MNIINILFNIYRPQFMAAYFNEPDHTAHSYGPNSTQVKFTYIRIREFI